MPLRVKGTITCKWLWYAPSWPHPSRRSPLSSVTLPCQYIGDVTGANGRQHTATSHINSNGQDVTVAAQSAQGHNSNYLEPIRKYLQRSTSHQDTTAIVRSPPRNNSRHPEAIKTPSSPFPCAAHTSRPYKHAPTESHAAERGHGGSASLVAATHAHQGCPHAPGPQEVHGCDEPHRRLFGTRAKTGPCSAPLGGTTEQRRSGRRNHPSPWDGASGHRGG
mmetsp:Transcript_40418/g.65622  ORF Transcript_40418/g.65622 Transcript_40418/m.65622 type:complete len:220 (-) Transcript_40418:332-991(-)